MSKKMPANSPNIAENEAKKMDKYASLKEDYLELQLVRMQTPWEIKGLRKKLDEGKARRKQLGAEVRFLRSRKRMFESKKFLELTEPEASTKDDLKVLCTNRSNMALIESLPIENDPITYGSPPSLQQCKSQLYSFLPETTGEAQTLTLARQQTASVTAIGDPVSKKRRPESNDTPNSSDRKRKKHKEKGQQKPDPPTDEGSDNSFWNKE